MKIKLSPQAEKALTVLNSSGYEAYIVGGCVRDSLLGLTPADFDITTSAFPNETECAFKDFRLIETGLKHGTVTVMIDGEPIEITTFRTEGSYTDGRRPDSVAFTRSLADDLIRRDFTVNAIAYSPETGVIDLCGGVSDLQNNILRAVGDPYKRFTEDGLRILRALRFSSVYGFEIAPETSKAIHSCTKMLEKLSAERIFSELKKLLCGKYVFKLLTEYSDVICKVIPELAPSVGFEQKNPHHIYDVYTHTAKAVASIPPTPVLRLSALLHDIGKPQTFSVSEDGTGHFYGHGEASVKLAEKVLRRLKCDNKTLSTVLTLIKHHDPLIPAERSAVQKKMRKLTPEVLSDLLDLKSADNLAQAPECFGRIEVYRKIREIMDSLIAENACFSLKDLAVNGDDIKNLGIPEGKAIGKTLFELLEAVENGEVKNEKDELLSYILKK